MFFKKSKNCYFNVDFIPCKRHDGKKGKDSYLFYYVRNPESGKLVRFKIMLNRYQKGAERDFMAAQISANVYNNYMKGITPFTEPSVSRTGTPLITVIGRYKTYIKKLEQKGAMSEKTITDYYSRLKIFQEWLEDRHYNNKKVYEMDTALATDFLDYVLLDRETTTLTRNNYRTWMSAFCAWLVEKMYLSDNPISKIPILPIKEKFREPLSVPDVKRMSSYLKQTDKRFLLACYFEYYTMIRPIELVKIRIRDIQLHEQTVFIPSMVSKNRKNGRVPLHDKIVKLMLDLEVFSHSGKSFLFGKQFIPSEERARSDIFRKRFSKLREELNFPDCYMFYSLKDTGIIDHGEKLGVISARDQARHSSVEVTNLYMKRRSGYVNEAAKHFDGDL
jgi:integrase